MWLNPLPSCTVFLLGFVAFLLVPTVVSALFKPDPF